MKGNHVGLIWRMGRYSKKKGILQREEVPKKLSKKRQIGLLLDVCDRMND
jgi:hypothetical protein